MILIPLGNDLTIRRMPWLTIAVMALCTIIQIRRTVAEPSESDFERLEHDRRAIQLDLVRRFGKLDTDEVDGALAAGARLGPLVKSLPIPESDPSLVRLAEVERGIERARRMDLGARFGFRPRDGLSPALLLSAFVHGGWLHLLGNLLFLWLVGCNLEDRWGRVAFGGLYLAGAIASSLTYALWHPGSDIPVIGASGAIAAAMGAFVVCYHDATIRYGYLLLLGLRVSWGTFEARALYALPLWFAMQLASAMWFEHADGGVAYSAHVGGFAFGVAVALALKWSGMEKKYLLPAANLGVEWEEDATFVEAFALVGAGRFAEAAPLLRDVIARKPAHGEAHIELCRAAIALGDADTVRATLPRAIGHLARGGHHDELIGLYRQLEDSRLDVELEERSLAELAQAATSVGNADLALTSVKQLARRFAQSQLLPRRLWDLAVLQESVARPDHARRTLFELVAHFPFDPFADRARARLKQPFAKPVAPATPAASSQLQESAEVAGTEEAPPDARVVRPHFKGPSPHEGRVLELDPAETRLDLVNVPGRRADRS